MAIANHSKRPAWLAAKMDKQVKQRTGIDRHSRSISICGLPVLCLVGAPEIVRERWIRKPASYGVTLGKRIKGRTYHFAVMCFKFQAVGGQLYTAMRVQCHDANAGYALSITGFYNLTPA